MECEVSLKLGSSVKCLGPRVEFFSVFVRVFVEVYKLTVCVCVCVCVQPSEMEVESQVQLYGHTGEVTSLFVCKPYSLLISVSRDGTCILWDLNRCVCRQGHNYRALMLALFS